MKYKKLIFIGIFLVKVSYFLYSVDIFEEFKNRVQDQYVNPFNKDLTGLICANPLNTAESLGLFKAAPPSIGLDMRASVVLKKISSENTILQQAFENQSFKYLPFSSLYLTKGLPFNTDLIFRFFGYSDVIFYGIGVKYRFLSLPPVVPVINFAANIFYNVLNVKQILKHTSYSVNFLASVDKLPFVKPYVLVGLDNSELVVDNALGIGEIKTKFSNAVRYELGLNLSFIPFVYFNLGYSNIYSADGYFLNLGAKF